VEPAQADKEMVPLHLAAQVRQVLSAAKVAAALLGPVLTVSMPQLILEAGAVARENPAAEADRADT